jgi:hypothetical protein
VRSFQFNPSVFPFTYYPKSDTSTKGSNFNTADLNLELKIAPDENYIVNQNSRISLGARKWPIFTMKYTHGFNNIGHGNFAYNKYQFNVVQYLNLAFFGKSRYAIDVGYIPNTLPYALLRPQLGNNTLFFYQNAFNTMNFFEFVSDHWMRLSFQQHFEGFLLNSIPKVRSWNLRLVASGNLLFAGMSKANQNLATYKTTYHLPNGDSAVTSSLPFSVLDPKKPYVEVGYGVENIFRVLRIDFSHRLTYLDHQPGAMDNRRIRPFKVQLSVQFML